MRQIRKDNTGSVLIMVVIGILFLGLLGSIISAATVLNARLKGGYQKERTTFYTADGILEEIRAGLGKISSRAVNEAYTSFMLEYKNSYQQGENQQARFSEKYLEVLQKELNDAGASSALQMYYDVDILLGLLEGEGTALQKKKDCVQIIPQENKMEIFPTEGYLLLKNIRVVYVDESNVETILTTDICLSAPSLSAAEEKNFYTELFQHALIGDQAVRLRDARVDGSVYAGKDGIFLGGFGLGSQINGGAVVSRGELLSSGNGNKLESQNLWLKNICLEGNGGSLTLSGNTNVSDDIEINGTGNQLILQGTYTGFGNEADSAQYSSAIMINGKKAVVDMRGLTSLILAGNSFIKRNEAGGLEGNDILLGESIAIKSDQLACFVPERYIKEKNGKFTLLWEEFADYAKVGEENKSLLNQTEPVTAYYYRQLSGTDIDKVGCYYFLNFKNQESAAEYYRIYGEANRDKLTNNSSLYLDQGIFLNDGLLYTATGQLLCKKGSLAELEWKDANVAGSGDSLLEAVCRQKRREYLSRQQYLTADKNVRGDYLPIDASSFVGTLLDTEKLKAMTAGEVLGYKEISLLTEDGTHGTVYLAGEGGITLRSQTEGIVLSLGDVTVEADFSGMIISMGTIKDEYAGTTIKQNPLLVEKLFYAEAEKYEDSGEAENQGSFLSLFRTLDIRTLWEEAHKSVDLSEYITYENWRKN